MTNEPQYPWTAYHWLDVSDRALLILEGSEAKDLLQRLSTNDLSNLDIGGSVQSILTNEKGRIIEVISVVALATDRLLVSGQSSEKDRLRTWLHKFIIMEDVQIRDWGEEYRHYILYPDEKARIAETGSTIEKVKDGLRGSLNLIPGDILFAERWGSVDLFHLLIGNNSKLHSQFISHDPTQAKVQFEQFRLLHTIPVSPNELSDLYNPLEANLWNLVSWTKGCYIGQEVIARLDTYKKVQKQLIRVRLSQTPDVLPVSLFTEGKEAGILTSAAGLDDGRVIGLAFIGTQALSVPSFTLAQEGKIILVERIADHEN